jgi:NADP-dependent 3-hydroxy acid dehydrogenase YdfG
VSAAPLAGRVVLVTGASAGIGAALAEAFAGAGADVALVARRVARLEALAEALRARGRRALAVAGDVTRDGSVEAAVARTLEAFGRLDVAVANAGFGVVGPLERLGLDDYRRQLETNVFGVLRTVYATLPALRASRGTLVLVGSVSGYLATPGASAYAMSKFAVRALADALRHELRPAGVAVVLVSPGLVASELRQVDNHGVHHPEARDRAPRWLVMPADRAARIVVRAVARRRPEVVVTGHGKLLVWLARHAPSLVAFGLRRAGYRSRPEAPAASR